MFLYYTLYLANPFSNSSSVTMIESLTVKICLERLKNNRMLMLVLLYSPLLYSKMNFVRGENKLILFDWSGTISDDRPPVYQSHVRMCQYYGIPAEKTLEAWSANSYGIPRDYHKRGVTDSTEAIWDLYKKIFLQVLGEGIHPTIFSDAAQVLKHLKEKGKHLVVISSHPQKYLHEEAAMYGIASYFDDIIGSIPTNKATEITAVYKRFGVHPDNTVYIGDMISDVLAAHEAGVRPIAVTRGYHSAEILLPHKPYKLWANLLPAKEEL